MSSDFPGCPSCATWSCWPCVLVVACFYGFSQDWHVEEERPIGSGEDYGAGAPQPA